MKTTTTKATTYDHAQRIARAACKGMTTGHMTANGNFTGSGLTGKAGELRRDINGRDRRTLARYDALYNGTTVYDDGIYKGIIIKGGDMVQDTPTPLSDSIDLIQEAACAICTALPDIDHNAPYELPESVAKTAFKAVHAYVYAQQKKPTTRQIYIADMACNDSGEVTDADYIRVTRYYDVDCYADYEAYQTTLNALKPLLTINQRTILHKRLQGLSVSQIAADMHVSQPAISKQLLKIQLITESIAPDSVRGFQAMRKR